MAGGRARVRGRARGARGRVHAVAIHDRARQRARVHERAALPLLGAAAGQVARRGAGGGRLAPNQQLRPVRCPRRLSRRLPRRLLGLPARPGRGRARRDARGYRADEVQRVLPDPGGHVGAGGCPDGGRGQHCDAPDGAVGGAAAEEAQAGEDGVDEGREQDREER